eukprot:5275339-Prymnesium_polylepis.1
MSLRVSVTRPCGVSGGRSRQFSNFRVWTRVIFIDDSVFGRRDRCGAGALRATVRTGVLELLLLGSRARLARLGHVPGPHTHLVSAAGFGSGNERSLDSSSHALPASASGVESSLDSSSARGVGFWSASNDSRRGRNLS